MSFVTAPLAQLAEHNALLAAARVVAGATAGGGDFDVPLDALARAAQWSPDEVRAELRRLEANRDIVCHAGDAGVRVRADGAAERDDRGRAGAVHGAPRVGAGAQARLRLRSVQAHGGTRDVERAGERL
jgi:hypothetical protein